MTNTLHDAEAHAEAIEYFLLLKDFENLQLELEVAILADDAELAGDIAAKLKEAEKAVRSAHARFFPKVQAEVNALIGRVQ